MAQVAAIDDVQDARVLGIVGVNRVTDSELGYIPEVPDTPYCQEGCWLVPLGDVGGLLRLPADVSTATRRRHLFQTLSPTFYLVRGAPS